MKLKNLQRNLLSLIPLLFAAALAGCSSPQMVYRVTGTASEAFVTYTFTGDGYSAHQVSLPWETTFDPNEAGKFELYAVNVSGEGTVSCEVAWGEDVLGDASGTRVAGCAGTATRQGSSLETNSQTYDDVWPETLALPSSALPEASRGTILFVGQQGDDDDLWVYQIGFTAEANRWTKGFDNGACPRWSPDGTRLAFRYDAPLPLGLYALNADGSGLVSLSADLGVGGDCPAWSPDGQQVAFGGAHKDAATGETLHDIFVVNADGSGLTQLTANTVPEDKFTSPSWAPDRQVLAFFSERLGGNQIFVMNADGSDLHAVAQPKDLIRDLAWSPAGNKLLYVCHESIDAIEAGVCLINPDGSGDMRLTDESFGKIWQARWSPNGELVTFVGQRGGQTGLFAVSTDGLVYLLAEVDRETLDLRGDWLDWFPLGQTPFTGGAAPLELVIGK